MLCVNQLIGFGAAADGAAPVTDLLIYMLCTDSSGTTHTPPSGWTELFDTTHSGGQTTLSAGYLIANTTANLTIVSASANAGAWNCYRIKDWHGTTPPEVATAFENGTAANADPPNLTPSWGSAATLWIAMLGIRSNTSDMVTAAPSGYSALVDAASPTDGDANMASAYRTATGSSENPGAFTSASGRRWLANTLGVRPGTGAMTVTTTSGTTAAGNTNHTITLPA